MAKFKRTQAANRERAVAVFGRLREAYPDARCSLDFSGPLELLVATILAAQCTDVRVNVVTKDLFRAYRTPRDYVDAPREELEAAIRTCGFFRQKAKSIVKACGRILDAYGGEVPGTMEELLTLDGVGRKTANVLLGECFDTPGIIVDTHCMRVSRRLGFTRQTDPRKIEQDLMKIWPRETWTLFSHCIVFHGRAVCQARTPKCAACTVADLCPSAKPGD
ncbi:MAG TPA: endonuclease III [Candidatus Hydrogenedentes bacterium]|nr:endonuclease III [Candidatus Hydrogenedentota bacterium]